MSEELPNETGPTTRPCEWCGEPVLQSAVGRARLYCKRSHRQRAFEARRLLELREAAGQMSPPESSQ